MSPRSVGSKSSKKRKQTKTAKPRSPRCHTCGRAIRIPAGWSPGSATRRHYWSKHRDRMLPGVGKGGR